MFNRAPIRAHSRTFASIRVSIPIRKAETKSVAHLWVSVEIRVFYTDGHRYPQMNTEL